MQLPFLQKTLNNVKIVPIVVGQCEYAALNQLAENLSKASGSRTDVLIIASTETLPTAMTLPRPGKWIN